MELKNKVALVTGASSGIGAAIAVQLSKEGSHVVIVGRNKEKLKNIAAVCREPLVICADVTKEEDAKLVVQETIAKFGKINILVNNAGVAGHKPIVEGDILKTYDFIMNVNFRAVVHITSLAVPYLIKSKGNIVNISSIAAVSPVGVGMSMYCSSKAALNQFTVCAAAELASHGIRVNAVSPGPVKTNIVEASDLPLSIEDFTKITALNRVSGPEEIADLVLFLASDKAKGITGSNFVTDNGALVKF